MTTIADLEEFNQAHKRQRSYKPCPPELITKYRGRLPDVLVNTWEAAGFQEFSNGFLWSVNPDEYRDVTSDFLFAEQTADVDVMFRTGLGDLVVYHKGKMFHFSAVTMRHAQLPDSVEIMLRLYFGQTRFLNDIFFFNMYKKGLKRLGPPAEDELYALAPAPAMGGDISAEHLEKAKLRVYLNYLSQLIERPAG